MTTRTRRGPRPRPRKLRPCRHCERRQATYSGGLCRACHETPAVRAAHPQGKTARRGVGAYAGGGYALPDPTDALPGTEEKVRVLEERAARGLALFHPCDARRDDVAPAPAPTLDLLTGHEPDDEEDDA